MNTSEENKLLFENIVCSEITTNRDVGQVKAAIKIGNELICLYQSELKTIISEAFMAGMWKNDEKPKYFPATMEKFKNEYLESVFNK